MAQEAEESSSHVLEDQCDVASSAQCFLWKLELVAREYSPGDRGSGEDYSIYWVSTRVSKAYRQIQASVKSIKLKSSLGLCEEPGSCEVSEYCFVDAWTQIFQSKLLSLQVPNLVLAGKYTLTLSSPA